ncbi:MAG: hypothetical protein K2X87_17195 [Gemmataceae bacterium]|nr:hypothetical protein [Gemmataceae bacterium]
MPLFRPLPGRVEVRRAATMIGFFCGCAGLWVGCTVADERAGRAWDWLWGLGAPLAALLAAALVYRGLTAAARFNDWLYRRDDLQSRRRRLPTAAEREGLELLGYAVRVLSPWLSRIWEGRPVHYTVAETELSAAAYFNGWGRRYREEHIFFAESIFIAAGFGRALAIYVHEHAHVFGADGSRRFTDALTEALEGVVSDRKHVDELEARWGAIRARVLDERLSAVDRADGG